MEEKLKKIAMADVDALLRAQKDYGDSWKKRGGVGAFMMLARKWDRIERQVERDPSTAGYTSIKFDIFAHLDADTRQSGLIDDIRDLRRYLILVESEWRTRPNDDQSYDGQGRS